MKELTARSLTLPAIRDRLLASRRGDASPAVSLAIVCARVVLASLDLFIVNVALPDMTWNASSAVH